MPLSKNLNTYHDVVAVLTTMRKQGGGEYELPSHGAAVTWRLRAYYYRKLLTEAAIKRAGSVRGFVPTTAWDDLYLTIEGNVVKIAFGKPTGKLRDNEGNEIPIDWVEVAPAEAENILATVDATPVTAREMLDEDLLAAAETLAREKMDK